MTEKQSNFVSNALLLLTVLLFTASVVTSFWSAQYRAFRSSAVVTVRDEVVPADAKETPCDAYTAPMRRLPVFEYRPESYYWQTKDACPANQPEIAATKPDPWTPPGNDGTWEWRGPRGGAQGLDCIGPSGHEGRPCSELGQWVQTKPPQHLLRMDRVIDE